MALKFSQVMTKGDWIKLGILIVIAVSCWVWVWQEYKKPIIPEEYLIKAAKYERNL